MNNSLGKMDMDHILRRIELYKCNLEYKLNVLTIHFTNESTNQIYFTNIIHQHLPENLKEIADNAHDLFEIISQLADNKLVIK